MGLMNRQTINIFRAISILYQAHYPVSIYLAITNSLTSVLAIHSPVKQSSYLFVVWDVNGAVAAHKGQVRQ